MRKAGFSWRFPFSYLNAPDRTGETPELEYPVSDSPLLYKYPYVVALTVGEKCMSVVGLLTE